MAKRHVRWAWKARRALIRELGGKCELCPCRDIERLEIDHKFGKTWRSRSISSSSRVCRCRREAKLGLLRVLCKSCNSRYRWWETYAGHVEYSQLRAEARHKGFEFRE